eukprot:COSAG02_NODE_7822_length_2833_cov_2.297366_3_plen_89_part_00
MLVNAGLAFLTIVYVVVAARFADSSDVAAHGIYGNVARPVVTKLGACMHLSSFPLERRSVLNTPSRDWLVCSVPRSGFLIRWSRDIRH